MASYNMGETRLLRFIWSMSETPGDRNFWMLLRKLRKQIPDETYDYVFRVVSAAVNGADPRLFGLDFDPILAMPSDARVGVAAR